MTDLQKRIQKLKIREEAIGSLLPIGQTLSSKVRDRISSNNSALLKELASNIEKAIDRDSFSEVIEAIESIDSNEKVVNEIGKLLKQIKKLEKKDYFDQKEFDTIFNTGIQKIVNILVRTDAVPNKTKYSRNSKGKITLVTEEFTGFTLKHAWKYNSKGDLASIITVKNETK